MFGPFRHPVGLQAFLLLTLVATGCAPTAPEGPVAAPPPPAPRLAGLDTPPVWQLGDRWIFEWSSGTASGTKTANVLERHEVGGVPYYVVVIADVEHYYTRDLHWAFAVRATKVEARMVPPKPWFMWPLEIGQRWSHRGAFEDSRGKVDHRDSFRAVGVESVEVPAGQFSALRIVRDGDRGESDEYWYAPAARWYVRWVGRRGDVSFEERLSRYDPAPRRP